MKRGTAAVRSAHRPAGKQCHYNGKKPDPAEEETGRKTSSSKVSKKAHVKGSKVLVAPVMHKMAFTFVGQFGEPIQKVRGCDRQGVIVPENRLKAFTSVGGALTPVDRPVDKPYNDREEVRPLIAIYPIDENGRRGRGQTYQITDYSRA